MKKTILFVFVLMVLACKTENKKDYGNLTLERIPTVKIPISEGKKRILFVGNSYTENYVSLPELFRKLCIENNKNLQVETQNEMIAYIEAGDTTSVYMKKDADGNYFDFVVLLEKMPIQAEAFDEYKTDVKNLIGVINKNSPGTVVLFNESITPLEYRNERSHFKNVFQHIKSNTLEVVKATPNSRMLNIGSAIKDAYEGTNDYAAYKGNTDLLRHGIQDLHMLNDAGFLASVVLYETVFSSEPKIPLLLPFCTGVGEDDKICLQKVNKVISNKDALLRIAFDNR